MATEAGSHHEHQQTSAEALERQENVRGGDVQAWLHLHTNTGTIQEMDVFQQRLRTTQTQSLNLLNLHVTRQT